MKLLRYGTIGQEKPGILDSDGSIRSLSPILTDIDGSSLTASVLNELRMTDIGQLPLVDSEVRIGPCVAKVSKFIGIGLNYSDHAEESGMATPDEPIVFMKAPSSISGPHDDIIIPRGSRKTDWEVELGVVIGDTARYVEESSAMQYVAGFCVINDVSEREFQLEHAGQWTKGKGCDTFGPIGPYLVTADEVGDPQDLDLWLEVDGHRYQHGNTRTMIFQVEEIVSYVSRFMTLEAGDILATGTPAGVGMGQKPPVFLRAGQDVRLGIEKLGEQRHRTVSANEKAPLICSR